jgi:hypothetical protein
MLTKFRTSPWPPSKGKSLDEAFSAATKIIIFTLFLNYYMIDIKKYMITYFNTK